MSDLVENPGDRFSHNAAQLCIRWGGGGGVLFHLCSFFKNFVCAYHTLASIKVVHLRSFAVTFARTFSQLFLGQLLVFNKVLALISLFTEIERYVDGDGDGKTVLRIDYALLQPFVVLLAPTSESAHRAGGNCVVKSIRLKLNKILFYVIIMIGPLHDKTSNFCLQLIMHKAKFNVYPHELENDHL